MMGTSVPLEKAKIIPMILEFFQDIK